MERRSLRARSPNNVTMPPAVLRTPRPANDTAEPLVSPEAVEALARDQGLMVLRRMTAAGGLLERDGARR
ncbi:hypothetical protein ACFQU7_37325 [Pseudoroseomonas wenyumeiae]